MGDILATANVSPDATLGGNDFDTHTNTRGVNGSDGVNSLWSYRCSGFPAVPNSGIAQVKMSVIYIGSPVAQLRVDISTNGGGAWTTVLTLNGFDPAFSPYSFDLPAGQNTSQVQIRIRHSDSDFVVGSDIDVDNIRISVPSSGNTGSSGGMM